MRQLHADFFSSGESCEVQDQVRAAMIKFPAATVLEGERTPRYEPNASAMTTPSTAVNAARS